MTKYIVKRKADKDELSPTQRVSLRKEIAHLYLTTSRSG